MENAKYAAYFCPLSKILCLQKAKHQGYMTLNINLSTHSGAILEQSFSGSKYRRFTISLIKTLRNRPLANFYAKFSLTNGQLKKIQQKEDIINNNWNNFGLNQKSLRYLNKSKTVTQAVCTIMGKCFWGCWQPIRCQLLKTLDQLTNQKLPIIVDKLFLSQKMP